MNENLPANQTTQAVGAHTPTPPSEMVLKSDIQLSKILLMQGSSEFVKKDRCRMPGDLALNSSKEKLGDDKQPVEFIPITFKNLWMLSEDEKGNGMKNDFKFRGYEPRTAANEDLEWDFQMDGTNWKRTKVVQVFVLLKRDLERLDAAMKAFEATGELPDLDSVVLPTVIAFKNTSFKGAKDVMQIFVKAKELSETFSRDIPAYSSMMQLEVHSETSKDGDDYFALRASVSGKTPKEWHPVCARWRGILLSGAVAVKIDESGEGGAAAPDAEAYTGQF